MFIMLRPKLKHTWWSKLGVASILAIAVCAMHFCGKFTHCLRPTSQRTRSDISGMMGTTYAWPITGGISYQVQLTGTNQVITAVVAALAFAACAGCVVFFIVSSMHARRERARRRRVVVATVLLDENDRMLVNSTDGMLPMGDIAQLTGAGGGQATSSRSMNGTMASDSTSLGMDLTIGHEAFVSAVKMSWGWKIPSLLPNAQLLEKEKADNLDNRRGSLVTSTSNSRPGRLSTAQFITKFSSSATQLAIRLTGQSDGMARLGVMYDQILTT